MKIFLFTLTALFISGCSTHKFVFLGNGPDRPMHDIAPDYTIKNKFWFFGIGQSKVVDIVNRCERGDNTVTIENYQSAGDSFFTIATLGIYAPTTIKIYCRY